MLQRQLLVQGCLLVLCALFSVGSIAETEYYTWVDDNGVTNYAQRKPVGHNAQFVNNGRPAFGHARYDRQDPKPPATKVPAAKTENGVGKDKIAKEIEAEQQRIAANVAATKKSNCAIGKQNLAQLEAFRRIRVRDADGQERVLNEEEKAERINQAKKTVQENCSG